MITVLDACCAINLHNAGLFGTLLTVPEATWAIGPRALEECRDECPDLSRSIVSGRVQMLDDQNISAALYLDLLARHGLGDGETECIAFATLDITARIATDDRRARRISVGLFSKTRVTGSLGLLRDCVMARLLSSSEAYSGYVAMVQRGGFLPVINDDFFIPPPQAAS